MAFQYEIDGRALEAPSGFAWLAEVEVPSSPITRLRVTTNNEPVSFGANINGESILYTPWPMTVGRFVRQKKGDLPQISISVSNAKRVLPGYLETYDGLVGQPAVVQMVSLGELDNASAALRFDGEVQGTEVSVEQVTFTIGSLNLADMNFPTQRFVAEHCRFRFGGAECGYNFIISV
jgi:phage-related protein